MCTGSSIITSYDTNLSLWATLENGSRISSLGGVHQLRLAKYTSHPRPSDRLQGQPITVTFKCYIVIAYQNPQDQKTSNPIRHKAPDSLPLLSSSTTFSSTNSLACFNASSSTLSSSPSLSMSHQPQFNTSIPPNPN